MPPASSWWLLTPFISAPPGLNFGVFCKDDRANKPEFQDSQHPLSFSLQSAGFRDVTDKQLFASTYNSTS